jgi:hypothetical protein
MSPLLCCHQMDLKRKLFYCILNVSNRYQ